MKLITMIKCYYGILLLYPGDRIGYVSFFPCICYRDNYFPRASFNFTFRFNLFFHLLQISHIYATSYGVNKYDSVMEIRDRNKRVIIAVSRNCEQDISSLLLFPSSFLS